MEWVKEMKKRCICSSWRIENGRPRPPPLQITDTPEHIFEIANIDFKGKINMSMCLFYFLFFLFVNFHKN